MYQKYKKYFQVKTVRIELSVMMPYKFRKLNFQLQKA